MSEIDPYAVLGVHRSAARDEIARAYRRLAKQHHPDAGVPASPRMARINDAWHILSDPARRARWDRVHTVRQPATWHPMPAEPARRPRAEPAAPPSRLDSGWAAVGIVAVVVLLVAALMIGVSLASQPPDDRVAFDSGGIAFSHPQAWIVAPGDGTDPADHRVIAHLVTFPVEPAELCTSFSAPCQLTGGTIPAGEASIVITAWDGGTPPVPEPVVSRPFGRDADAIIGGKPAAFELERTESGAVAWWQLSPPGFPDRWIEIQADIGGREREQEEIVAEINALLETVEFRD